MEKNKRTSLGILFWIAVILFVLVVFLLNRSNLERVIDSTGLLDLLRDKVGLDDGPEVEREPVSIEDEAPEDDVPIEAPSDDSDGTEVVLNIDDAGSGSEGEEEGEESQEVPEEEDDDAAAEPQPRLVRNTKIYFIRATEDGNINLQYVERPINFAQSPMTETIHTLIEGPKQEELDIGLLNLIPENTLLLWATVKNNGTAYLNFNEAFRFNPLGVEGYIAQLKQIVYSTTEFNTVKKVQILIEGKQVDYLSPEGIYIKEPLNRKSFS